MQTAKGPEPADGEPAPEVPASDGDSSPISEENVVVDSDPAGGRDAYARTGPISGPDPLADGAFEADSFDSMAEMFDTPTRSTSRVEVDSLDDPDEPDFEVETLVGNRMGGAAAGASDSVAGKTIQSLPSIPDDAIAPPPEEDLGPGEPLGPTYRVIEKLGEGGMGTIYAVEHVRMRKRFAAKVLKSALCTPDNIKRMEREATASSRIDHPNVVRVVNLDEDQQGRLFIISELLVGQDLSAWLRRGPIPASKTVGITIQVAAGLGAAHHCGVIHRDLKPENIFMCTNDGPGPVPVKVLDFGISSMLFEGDMERLTAVGSLIGTPRYMSPEHASRNPVDARSDVYSLGILMFEMLTGNVPFEHAKPMQVILMHLRDLPPPPSTHNATVPAALDRVVLKCLAKDPEVRYPDMDAVADDLRAIADASGWSVPTVRTSVPTKDVVGLAPATSTPSVPARRIATEQNPPADELEQVHDSPSILRTAVLVLLAALAAAAVATAMGGASDWGADPPSKRRIIEPKHKLADPPTDSLQRTGGGAREHDNGNGQP